MTTITTTFPFLHLPSVATGEVLKFMAPFDQLRLSFVSEKTKNIVKAFARRLRISFYVSVEFYYNQFSMKFLLSKYGKETLIMELEEVKDSSISSKPQLRLDGVTVPVYYRNNKNKYAVTSYWKEKSEGLKHLLNHFLNVFDLNISLFIRNQNEHLVSDILSKLEASKVDCFNFKSTDATDGLYQKILEFPCKELRMDTSSSRNFRYQNSVIPMKFSEVFINKSYCVNLDDFLFCKQVMLFDTNVKPNEFNRFIKKWSKSESQLEYLQVEMSCPNFSLVVEGVSATPLNRACTDRGVFLNFADGKCFEIQRSNGEKAIVHQGYQFVFLSADSFRLA